MAIEKEYLTTYGWTAKNAYFKIDNFKKIEEFDDLYEMTFFIYMNKKNREENPDVPLTRNKLKFTVDVNLFDNTISEIDNLKKQGYNFLKKMSRSFQKYSVDV